MKMLPFTKSVGYAAGVIAVLAGGSIHAQDTPSAEGLKQCISDYRGGEYWKTVDNLTKILPTLTVAKDSLIALKYLAFSYGMLNMIDSAKGCFKIALQKQGDMEIDTLECPPNITIIYKQVKLENAYSKLSAAPQIPAPPPPPPEKPEITAQPRKIPVTPIILLAVAVAAGGAGGYFLYNGIDMQNKYDAVEGPYSPEKQELMNQYTDKAVTAYTESAVCSGISAILFSVSIYLFIKEPTVKSAYLDNCRGMPTVGFRF